jgi:hypothetical protein
MLAVMSDEPLPVPESPLPPTVEPEPVAARPRARWVVPLAAGVAGLIVGAGGVGLAWGLTGDPAPSAAKSKATFTLAGTMTLSFSSASATSGSQGCEGRGGYKDIAQGAAVTVYDGGGAVVATGSLGGGVMVGSSCRFTLYVEQVPEGADFFQVEVSHRGKLTLSAADAKAGKFAATLG